MAFLKKILEKISCLFLGFPANKYNHHAWIIGNPKIGVNCWIGPFTVIDGSGDLEIGEGTTISCGAHIYTHSAIRRNISSKIYPNVDRKQVKIGRFCHIGPNSTILMGVKMGDRVVVGAGAVVLENSEIPDNAIVVGNPARIVKNDSSGLWKDKQ